MAQPAFLADRSVDKARVSTQSRFETEKPHSRFIACRRRYELVLGMGLAESER